jgi:hypothetical protein
MSRLSTARLAAALGFLAGTAVLLGRRCGEEVGWTSRRSSVGARDPAPMGARRIPASLIRLSVGLENVDDLWGRPRPGASRHRRPGHAPP